MEGPGKRQHRKRTARLASRWARALAILVVLGGAASAIVAAGACLPDLAAIAAADAALEASAPFRGCGDGIIETLADGGDTGESCDPGPDAQVASCKTCKVACSEGLLDSKTGHCYFTPGNASSYPEAQRQCQAAKGHVVTFASDEEVAFVRKVASDETEIWIGLSVFAGAYVADRREEPGFPRVGVGSSGTCDGCYAVGTDAGVFAIGDDASDTTCIASRGGRWVQVSCSGTARTIVCEREPVGVRAIEDCIIGGVCFSVPSTAKTKTYVLVVSEADPEQAAQTCAGLQGGSLVVFDSREEREQVAHEILARYPDEAEQKLWIGLSDDAGTWTWEDGVVAGSRPLPWGNAQPPPDAASGARAFMRLASFLYDTQLAYADEVKNTPHLFICQRPAR